MYYVFIFSFMVIYRRSDQMISRVSLPDFNMLLRKIPQEYLMSDRLIM